MAITIVATGGTGTMGDQKNKKNIWRGYGNILRRQHPNLKPMTDKEYEELIKSEVQRAISADDEALIRLCSAYIDNVKAFTRKEKVKNAFTGKDDVPDERLMRSIENWILCWRKFTRKSKPAKLLKI